MNEPFPWPLDQARAFLRSHGLPEGPLTEISGQAWVNWVFLVGESHVLRINRITVETDDAYTERVAVPAVRKAGIRTPELVVFDDSRSVIDSVVTVYEQVEGRALGRLPWRLEGLREVYTELGVEIARIQQRVTEVDDPHGWLDEETVSDLGELVPEALESGKIEAVTAAWLEDWASRLDPAGASRGLMVFAHQDFHSFNLLVSGEPMRLNSVIDWGDAGWADASCDFCSAPVWAVPWMIEGYEAEGGVVDEAFVGRILTEAVGTLLDWEDHPGKEPWAPQVSSFWANLVRLMAMDLDSRWSPWLPDFLPGVA
ncbi:MAG: aminoglycoside phosphotransferase family protein [Fimbriimonadaceae bacterium]|nr:aminoglycoside phosphotransferase family protein [Fimbriimonadaceae bacterium]QYK59439.1 MAG: aminoglycoside phosphotransferase family protein [Fimbriimonadaceae bacterium]